MVIREPIDRPLIEADDKEIALAFQRGDERAYREVYTRYRYRVGAICRRMLGNAADAEEASQETFLRVYTALASFNGRYQLGAWISRIATNVCLDQIRARSRRPGDASLFDLNDATDIPATVDDEPENFILRRADTRRVRKILAELPPTHRAAIVLRDFEGLSYEEVGVALDLSVGQVKALLHRARRGFRRSWTSTVASLLIPDRLLERLRRFQEPLKEQAAHRTASQVAEVASSAAPTVASCSGVLQQCTQIVGERVGPLVTAALLGTATVGAGAAAVSVERAPEETAISTSEVQSDGVERAKPRRKKPSNTQMAALGDPVAPSDSIAEDPRSVEQPSPSPSPSPTPSPGPTKPAKDAKEPNGGRNPSTNPSTDPFYAAIGFDRGQPVPESKASSNNVYADCDLYRLQQRLQIAVSDGDASYPGTLSLDVTRSTARLELRLVHDGEHYYISWGQEPIATWTRSGSTAEIEVSGDYGRAHGSSADAEDLPRSGRFSASLTVDCATGSVVRETVVFTVD